MGQGKSKAISEEGPALIQFGCERCKTRFVLRPSSRKLGLGGKLRAFSMGAWRTVRFHEGLGSGYGTARRQLLGKMDDEAYKSFVESFHFCHECRQFVCDECWSASARNCLTCVATAITGGVRPPLPFAPIGPEIQRPVVSAAILRADRPRRDAALPVLAAAVVLLAFEGGFLLAAIWGGPAALPAVAHGPSPAPSPAAPQYQAEPSPSGASTLAGEGPVGGSAGGPVAVGTPTLKPAPQPTRTPNSTLPPTPTPTFSLEESKSDTSQKVWPASAKITALKMFS